MEEGGGAGVGAGAGLGAGPTHEVKTWLRPDTGPDEDGEGEDEGAGCHELLSTRLSNFQWISSLLPPTVASLSRVATSASSASSATASTAAEINTWPHAAATSGTAAGSFRSPASARANRARVVASAASGVV